jgi:hypothetical protein
MRTFFAIDRYSSLRPSTIRKLLALSFSRQQYEVLPLEEACFGHDRTSLQALQQQAHRQASRILEHYDDADHCLVVFGRDIKITKGIVSAMGKFDHVLSVRRTSRPTLHLLNPRVPGEENNYWASAPNIHYELSESLLEAAELPLSVA